MSAREYDRPKFAPLGDGAIIVRLGEGISRELATCVRAKSQMVASAKLAGVCDVVPTYDAFSVHFDSRATNHAEMCAQVERVIRSSSANITTSTRFIEIPVVYDGEDLSDVASAVGLTRDEVVKRHTSRAYYAYMLGFLPGFAYLGDLDAALRLERRAVPRKRVPRGSVAIAGAQTAIYPLDSPGGWHIIGHTDLLIFDAQRDRPGLLRAGDTVRFVPVVR